MTTEEVVALAATFKLPPPAATGTFVVTSRGKLSSALPQTSRALAPQFVSVVTPTAGVAPLTTKSLTYWDKKRNEIFETQK